MKQLYNNFIALMAGMLLFAACTDEASVPDQDEVEIDIEVITRDNNFQGPSDGYINDITLLAFVEKTSGMDDYYFSYQSFRANLGTIEDDNTGRRTVRARVKKMPGKKQRFAMITNLIRTNEIINPNPILIEAEPGAESVPMQQALNRYIYKNPSGWSNISGSSSDPFPMFGITAQGYEVKENSVLPAQTITIALYRMVAKIELFLHQDLTIDYNLDNVCTMKNTPDEGYICFNNEDTYMNDNNYQTKGNDELRKLKAWIPGSAGKRNQQNYTIRVLTEDEKKDTKNTPADCMKRVDGVIYVNETVGREKDYDQDRDFYFEFQDKDNPSTKYKLYINPDMLRNCQYQLVVKPNQNKELEADIISWKEVNIDTKLD